MRSVVDWTKLALLLAAVAGFGGCRGEEQPTGTVAAEDPHEHEHEHEHEAPHGGHVVELGSENHHAEVTHDEATHTVAVYVLDASAAANAPVEVESVTINTVANGQPQQFTLPSKPLADDPTGKTSYFELVDETLCDGLAGGWDPHTSSARLNITIDGKPYVGEIELHEDHDEHEHAGDDEHAHE